MTEKELDNELKIANKYKNLYNSAKTRNIDFNITISELKKIYKRKICPYTKVKFIEEDNHDFSKTIDRIDNNKGYVSGNIIVCAKSINTIKSNLTIEEIENIYKITKKCKNS